MEIKDNSNDKKYFTIIPNYILDNSTAIEQALYLQMKRIAGENGKCKASRKYFRKQLGIGKKSLENSFRYLLEQGWITKTGKEPINTSGGKQKVNCYIVNDVWEINNKYFSKGGSERDHLQCKGGSERDPRGVPKYTQGGSQRDHKEELIKKNKKEEHNTGIINILNIFSKINPTLNYSNKTQRKSCISLINKIGLDKTVKAATFAISTHGMPYAPVITTPYLLEKKFAELSAFFKRNNNQQEKGVRL